MKSDPELLKDYVVEESEEAFAELVRRHTDMVYSAALREVQGDAHLAKDVAQAVFVTAARKARELVKHPSIASWLYKSVRFEARNVTRSARRRSGREKEAQRVQDLVTNPEPQADLTRLLAALDDGIHLLKEADRQIILLRFFERKRLGEVGEALGMTEDAVRKRIERAVERLRSMLRLSGPALSMAALTEALETHAVTAAPGWVSTGIISAGVGVSSEPTLIFLKLCCYRKRNLSLDWS